MDKQDIEVFMDDRTVVTNRLLIDILLCSKHRDIHSVLGEDASMDTVLSVITSWIPKEKSINQEVEELVLGVLGREMAADLMEARLNEFQAAESNADMNWGYK